METITIEGDGGVPPAPDEFITAPSPRVEGADLSARLSPAVAATPGACEVSER